MIFKRFQELCQTAACGWKEVVEQFMLKSILEGKLPDPPKLPEDKLAQIIVDLERKTRNAA